MTNAPKISVARLATDVKVPLQFRFQTEGDLLFDLPLPYPAVVAHAGRENQVLIQATSKTNRRGWLQLADAAVAGEAARLWENLKDQGFSATLQVFPPERGQAPLAGLYLYELIGSPVRSTCGLTGIVSGFMESQAGGVVSVDLPDGTSILVPFVEAWVEWDASERTLKVFNLKSLIEAE